jgi:hypothetical protein
MLSQPTTDKILLAIADDLHSVIAPTISDEQAKILLEQAEQLLRRLSRRSASEIAWTWMVEEIGLIEEVLGLAKDNERSLYLADVAERYSHTSGLLGNAIKKAFDDEDTEKLATLKKLLVARIAKEQEILGQLDLVGRG